MSTDHPYRVPGRPARPSLGVVAPAAPEASLPGVLQQLEELRDKAHEQVEIETAAFEQRIAGRVAELNRMNAAISHLKGEAGVTTRARPPKVTRGGSGAPKGPRGGKVLNAVIAHVNTNGFQPSSVIAKAVVASGVTDSEGSAHGAIQRLAKEGRIAVDKHDGQLATYGPLQSGSEAEATP